MEEEKFDVIIEVGHKATLKDKIDSNGNTHKWNAFVRSGDQSNQQKLDLIVKKVVFNLHETFKNPTRQCYTQPYCVKENGYGQFEFPIDIYFNGIDTKYSIQYYLELPQLDCTQPLSRVRKEKITFINPSPEFRKILVEGGSILHKSTKLSSSSSSNHSDSLNDSENNNYNKNVQKSPKLNASNSSNLSMSSSSSSSLSSASPSSNNSSSSLTPDKKLKNKVRTFLSSLSKFSQFSQSIAGNI